MTNVKFPDSIVRVRQADGRYEDHTTHRAVMALFSPFFLCLMFSWDTDSDLVNLDFPELKVYQIRCQLSAFRHYLSLIYSKGIIPENSLMALAQLYELNNRFLVKN